MDPAVWIIGPLVPVLLGYVWWTRLHATAARLREHEVEQLRAAVDHDPEDIVVLNAPWEG